MIYEILTIKSWKWACKLEKKKVILLSKSGIFLKESIRPRIYSSLYQVFAHTILWAFEKEESKNESNLRIFIVVLVTKQISWGWLEMTRWRIHRQNRHSTVFSSGTWWIIYHDDILIMLKKKHTICLECYHTYMHTFTESNILLNTELIYLASSVFQRKGENSEECGDNLRSAKCVISVKQ